MARSAPRPLRERQAPYEPRFGPARLTAMRKLLAVLFLFQATTAGAADCDRACLRALMTQTLDAFAAHQPNAAFAPAFRYIEDTIVARPGDGLWKDTVKLRPY